MDKAKLLKFVLHAIGALTTLAIADQLLPEGWRPFADLLVKALAGAQ